MSFEGTQKPKKSLFIKPPFKRPAGATKTQGSTDATDLFSRSKSSYQAVIEEEEKRIERRAAKVAQRNDELQKREGISRTTEKRQYVLISSSDSSSSEHESATEGKRSQTRSSPCSPPQAKTASLQVMSNVTTHAILSSTDRQTKDISHNEDSQDTIGAARPETNQSVILSTASTQRKTSSIIEEFVEEEDDIESDEELAEIARQARETAEKKRIQSQSEAENAAHSFQHGDSFTLAHIAKAKAPAVFIFVDSPLPGAERKTFKRPLDKRIREIRLKWCDANGYSDEEAQGIILVFRGKRVFDVNTPASLGISVDDDGQAHVEGDDSIIPLDNGDIVMEAIKEDNLDAYAETWARNHGLIKSSYYDDDDECVQDVAGDISVPAPEDIQLEQRSLKIICRTKGYPDFKVLVKRVYAFSLVRQYLANNDSLRLYYVFNRLSLYSTSYLTILLPISCLMEKVWRLRRLCQISISTIWICLMFKSERWKDDVAGYSNGRSGPGNLRTKWEWYVWLLIPRDLHSARRLYQRRVGSLIL